jgi:hypothetical protein
MKMSLNRLIENFYRDKIILASLTVFFDGNLNYFYTLKKSFSFLRILK